MRPRNLPEQVIGRRSYEAATKGVSLLRTRRFSAHPKCSEAWLVFSGWFSSIPIDSAHWHMQGFWPLSVSGGNDSFMRALLVILSAICLYVSAATAQTDTSVYSAPADTVGVAVVMQLEPGDPLAESCREVRQIPISLVQPMPNFGELDAVRKEGIRRAAELAVEQVIGLSVYSSQEAETRLLNEVASSKFLEERTSTSGGLVTYRLVSEQVVEVVGNQALKLNTDFRVCMPKSEAELRAQREVEERKLRPPKQLEPDEIAFFSPVTGEPQVWYWRSSEGELEFFDNSGFHPGSGDPLQPVTKDIVNDWRGLEKDRKVRQAERERRQDEERRAGVLCDQYAANPYDLQKSPDVTGVSFGVLQSQLDEAIRSCELAYKQYPGEPRYAYQLGRALQRNDVKRAIGLYQSAAAAGQIAAYDNLGWSYAKIKDQNAAEQAFLTGASLGDPSCMYSWGTILEKRSKSKRVPEEALVAYYQAAQRGHMEARARLAELGYSTDTFEQQFAQEAERDEINREQAMQLMQGIFGAILR
jgi:hypothetical protein